MCNTTDHAWFRCRKYKYNQHRVFHSVIADRQGLCPIVHDMEAHHVWQCHFQSGDRKTRALTLQRPGPWTPQFTVRMWKNGSRSTEIKMQLDQGRKLPWHLSTADLTNVEERLKRVVLDPNTNPMSENVVYQGTMTKTDDIIKLMKPKTPSGTKSLSSGGRRLLHHAAGTDPRPCNNCGLVGHSCKECLSPCTQCGERMNHGDHLKEWLNGRCRYLCWCSERPGHPYWKCTRPCRTCVLFLEDKNKYHPVGDCPWHCGVHPKNTRIMAVDEHNVCIESLDGVCQECNERGAHWPQDCPQFLRRLCMVSDCKIESCLEHCNSCGMGRPDGQQTFTYLKEHCNATESDLEPLRQISIHWHNLIHGQWDRVFTDDISGNKPWSILRCKKHPAKEFKVEDLNQIRLNTLKRMIEKLRSSASIQDQATVKVLSFPECPDCFLEVMGGKANYVERTPAQ